MFSGWQAHGGKSEIDIARDRFHDIMRMPQPTKPKLAELPMGLSQETERRLKAIVAKALAAL
jgi:hypothetical protein